VILVRSREVKMRNVVIFEMPANLGKVEFAHQWNVPVI
jgi:hypothetical protein